MTRPRKALVSLDVTPYYHITSRCVRRAFLCGEDSYSGKSYEHRRQWIVDRIHLLSSIFAIDICAYAVMSNHYHLVLKVSPEQVSNLPDEYIIERWCSLFKGPLIVQRYRQGEVLSVAEQETLGDITRTWRDRLASISWFMRCLNQTIARQANLEDGCTGKFWECRFTSQALKTEEALLSCMAYVDLNPIRAGMAETPESSEYTSIRERTHALFDLKAAVESQCAEGDLYRFELPLKPLLHFSDAWSSEEEPGIPCAYQDYLDLVDWSGRIYRQEKRGRIDQDVPAMLPRIDISADQWLINTTRFEAIHPARFNRAATQFGSG